MTNQHNRDTIESMIESVLAEADAKTLELAKATVNKRDVCYAIYLSGI